MGKESQISIRHRVSVVVLHRGNLLAFKAIDPFNGKEYLFLPGGKIEQNESPEEAAVRETREETGYSIKVISQPCLEEAYNFNWNGQTHNCRTQYFKGSLLNNKAEQVCDAPYNKGVQWVPKDKIELKFSYHPQILSPIKRLLEIS